MVIKTVDALKANKDIDLHGLNPEAIATITGEETIHTDNLEDLQWLANQAYYELLALHAEFMREFNPKNKN